MSTYMFQFSGEILYLLTYLLYLIYFNILILVILKYVTTKSNIRLFVCLFCLFLVIIGHIFLPIHESSNFLLHVHIVYKENLKVLIDIFS